MACQFPESCRGVRRDLRKIKAASDELSGAAIEDCGSKYRLERPNAAFRVGMRETGSKWVESTKRAWKEDQRTQHHTDTDLGRMSW